MASTTEVGAHLVVGEEGLRDGRGVGHAGRLDEDAVEAVLALHEAAEDADEVAAHGAAEAAVVHFEQFFLAGDDELVVDADFAEFVFDHRELLAVLFGEDAVEQRGLAGAEEAGEDGDGNGGHGLWKLNRSRRRKRGGGGNKRKRGMPPASAGFPQPRSSRLAAQP